MSRSRAVPGPLLQFFRIARHCMRGTATGRLEVMLIAPEVKEQCAGSIVAHVEMVWVLRTEFLCTLL